MRQTRARETLNQSVASVSRRTALAWSAGAAASIVTFGSLRAAETAIDFMVLGDWGQRGGEGQRRVAAALTQSADLRPPRFIISTGDNFYPKGVAAVDDPLWRESFEDVYTAASLQCPWCAVLGNHDHLGNTQAQLEYARRNPRWIMPAFYYSRVEPIGNGVAAEFFFLDTNPLLDNVVGKAERDAQVAWLSSALSRSAAKWKIVVGHHPIVSAGPHMPKPALVESLKPLLQKHNVQAYFNGHEHNLQHHADAGVDYFTSGAGGSVRATTAECRDSFCSTSLGFLRATLTPETMHVDIIGAESGPLLSIVVTPT